MRVKAVDAFGAESSRNGLMFIVGDPNRGGGMVLTAPKSYLEEPRIQDATLVRYTFTVPAGCTADAEIEGQVIEMNAGTHTF